MDPSDKRLAPEPLRVVQEFVNTRSNLRDLDVLGERSGAERWLVEHNLLASGQGVLDEDRLKLVAFRESLREILTSHNGAGSAEAAAGGISDLSGSSLLRVAFTPSGEPRLLPTGQGVERAVATMLSTIVGSSLDGSWERLKACRNEECRWAFYDASKNHSGTWCDMQTCGARHKMRAYRKRRQQ